MARLRLGAGVGTERELGSSDIREHWRTTASLFLDELTIVHPGVSGTSPRAASPGRAAARHLGVADRAEFVRAAAEDLSPIPDGSVDVVTTRSVLIYVREKDAAFREFHRVLRPGGRISIFEPINNYFPDDMDDFWGFDAHPVRDLVEKIWVLEGWDASHHPVDPMMNFNERDLLRHAEEAGFAEIHLELVVDVEPRTWVEDWKLLLGTAPNPNARTTGEAIAAALTPEEAERFEGHLRPLVEAGRGLKRSAFAYLWAVKSSRNANPGSSRPHSAKSPAQQWGSLLDQMWVR